jgi:hypothetical protein
VKYAALTMSSSFSMSGSSSSSCNIYSTRFQAPERNRSAQNTTLTRSRSTEVVAGVVGGLENVDVREEKSRTGEDMAEDVLENHREMGGMEGGEDAKTPPRTRSQFATVERVVQIKLLTSGKLLNIYAVGRKHTRHIGPGHGFSHSLCM